MLARVDLRGCTDVRRRAARDRRPRATTWAATVAAIIADVRRGGDAAVRDLHRAVRRLPGRPTWRCPLRDGRRARAPRSRAASRARAGARPDRGLARGAGRAGRRARARRRAGPGAAGAGRPGRVLRAGRPGPARVVGADDGAAGAGRRGCRRRALHAARPDGTVHDAILAAAWLADVDVVYRVGGAQAIAALAYGTETIDAVDVIVGPGNAYVAEAKRQVAVDVGIDGYAGPSEVAVVADATRRAGARRGRPARAGRARPRRRGRADHVVDEDRHRRRARARSAARRRTARRATPRRRCAPAGGWCSSTGPSRRSPRRTPSPPNTSS